MEQTGDWFATKKTTCTKDYLSAPKIDRIIMEILAVHAMTKIRIPVCCFYLLDIRPYRVDAELNYYMIIQL